MAKITKKKPTKIKKLTVEEQEEKELEQHWEQAAEKSQTLIVRLFDANLPIHFTPQNIDLKQNTDWSLLANSDIPQFHEEDEELPSPAYLAEEIAYHYLLTIVKRLLTDLSNYDCHDPAFFQNLISYEENY